MSEQVDAFRFWVGTEGERWSSVWKIWEKNSQIYALSTSHAGDLKLSLHSPNVCQFGFGREFRKQRNYGKTLGGIPTFARWERAPATSGKAVPLAILRFPTDFLCARNVAPPQRPGKFQSFLGAAPKGKCVELLFVAVQDPRTTEPLSARGGGYTSIAEMPLGYDERCLIVGRHCDFDPRFPVGRQFEVPNDWLPEDVRKLDQGEEVIHKDLLLWKQPRDFEPIEIVETTGLSLTKNYERKVPREMTRPFQLPCE
ncbi:hypothetical protein [Ostreiculturibacter nitratireducens]|uniref:hypothetical protein n=1 Tax=Ostreiculturibacter nitratireducens TaxID=3075226 RepID=UPI0031B5787B